MVFRSWLITVPFQLSACLVSLPPCCPRTWAEPCTSLPYTWLQFFSFQAQLGILSASLRFPSGSPFHHSCTLLRAMPERELWPEGPGSEPGTHIGSCDSMTSTTSSRSGSVCTLSCTLATLHACFQLWLPAPSLSSPSSASESQHLVDALCL